MKRALTTATALVTLLVMGVVTAAAAGIPEIDRANATFDLRAKGQVLSTPCPGEDLTNYVTLRGTWVGTETEVTPGFTDYVLSGKLTLKNVEATFNQTTGRGVLTATASLLSLVSGTTTRVKTYVGPLTLILQTDPAGGGPITGRGFLDAPTFTTNPATGITTKDGGSVLANVEILMSPTTFVIHGVFGDAAGTLGVPNFSVTTMNQTC